MHPRGCWGRGRTHRPRRIEARPTTDSAGSQVMASDVACAVVTGDHFELPPKLVQRHLVLTMRDVGHKGLELMDVRLPEINTRYLIQLLYQLRPLNVSTTV